MEPIRILVVEDDQDINRLLCTILNDAGYFSQSAFSGSEAMLWAEKEGFDLVLLDLMLPGLTGEEFIAKVRQHGTMPIIVLSAKAGVEDRVKVLRLGADDFIPKPFDNQEVLARVEAQLRRYTRYNEVDKGDSRDVLDFNGLVINRATHECTLYDKELNLTPIEFDILWMLSENRGQVISAERLFESVWGEKYLDRNNTVMVHIRRLREKMGEPSRNPRFIKTVWGVGYKID